MFWPPSFDFHQRAGIQQVENQNRFHTGNFAPEAPFGTHGFGRMRKRDISGPFRPLVGPGAARNATGATFAGGSFRPLDLSGPYVPSEC